MTFSVVVQLLLTGILILDVHPADADCTFNRCTNDPSGTSCEDSLFIEEESTFSSGTVIYTVGISSTTGTPAITESCTEDYCGLFIFEPSTKNLTASGNKLPDRDTLYTGLIAQYTFECDSATLTLNIYLDNINDNEASFEKDVYTAEIPELTKPPVEVDFGGIILKDADKAREFLEVTSDEPNVPFDCTPTWSVFSDEGKATIECIVKNPPPLDFERVQSYNLTLSVKDTQNGTYKNTVSTTLLRIVVQDLDDMDPIFNNTQYTASTTKGQIGLLAVNPPIYAYDQDSLRVAVVYSIADTSNGCSAVGSFKIDPESGAVNVTRRDLSPGECNIQLKASQSDDELRYATAYLTLTVIDVDDSCPKFPVTSISGRIDLEDQFAYVEDGVEILALNATDDDMEFIGTFTLDMDPQLFDLSILSPNSNSRKVTFRVKPGSKLSNSEIYNLTVTVGTPNCSDTEANVSIAVRNLSPEFDKTEYDASIVEGTAASNPLTKVLATAAGTGPINYILKSATGGGIDYFTIDESTGEITATSEVDAEEVDQYILFIEAQDRSWLTARVSFALVYINVVDINDNSPEFTSTSYTKCIPEDYATDSEILTVTANDADRKNVLQYEIEDMDLPFKINNETGAISVSRLLDVDGFGNQSEYTFVVTVSDGDPDHDQSVNVTICVNDVNDNPPVFDVKYSWFLPEEEEIVNVTFQVSATDLDAKSQIVYSLKDADPRFQILDDKIGNITVSGTFDREMQNVFEVIVVANDGKYQASTMVMFHIQDVNDQKPVFDLSSSCSQADLEISEGLKKDEAVCQVFATDSDETGTENANITYSVQNGEDFAIEQRGGVYELVLVRLLDRETTSKYTLDIVATDLGSPPLNATLTVSLKVTDINDNAPIFEKSVMDVILEEETSYAAGSLVVQLTVTDKDETNYYMFETSGKDADSFLVVPTDKIPKARPQIGEPTWDRGCIVYVKTTLLSYKEPYILVIRVANTDQPKLEEPRSTIRLRIFAGGIPCLEFMPQNPVLTMTVPDGSSSGNLTFDIVEMSVNYTCSGAANLEDVVFGITRQLYQESQDSPQADTELFTIDTSSGLLFCNSSIGAGLYMIDLEVFNGTEGNKSIRAYTTVELRLTAPANVAPTFSADEFLLPTQILPVLKNTVIMDLSRNVTDDDYPSFGNGEIVFNKISEECSGCTQTDLFQVTLSGKLMLDVDLTTLTPKAVNVTVMVEDRAVTPLSNTAVMRVEFQAASTAPPVFVEECRTPIRIEEELSSVQLVCSVRAVTGDDLPVVYGFKGDEPGNFTINTQTGEIYTTRSFDYDTTDRRFDLLVYAKTTGMEGYTVVEVLVVDVNDHAPEFIQSEYSFEISEDTNLTDCDISMQWMVKATDTDATAINKDIEYSIVGGSEYFEIDPSTGIIQKLGCIDAENSNITSSTITLTINATNRNAVPQLAGSIDVTFVVQDFNDNTPTFDSTDYIVRWPYFASSVDMVQVQALDKDVSEYNSAISYSFVAGQDAMVYQYFSINSDSGLIRTQSLSVNGSVDFGEKTDIKILVEARDKGSPPQVSKDPARVALIIDPTFQEEPYFYEGDRQQQASIPENVIGWCSGFRKPNIPDNPEFKVVYEIIGVTPESESSMFFVNDTEENSPKICNNNALDRETTKEYIITVKSRSCNTTERQCMSTNNARRRRQAVVAPNGGDFSTVVIRLFVSDVNDANPQIQKNFITGVNKYLIAVPDNTPYGANIFQIQATDEDTVSSLEYTLVPDEQNLPKFTFIQSDGSLQVQDLVSLYLDEVNVDPAKEQAAYNVTFRVVDSLTMDDASDKASSEVEAKIKVLYIFEYAVLVVNKPPMEVESEKTVLMDCLSKKLGFVVVADRVEAHIVVGDGLTTVDDKKSDVWVYAIDVNKDGGSFLKYWDIKKQWSLASSEVAKCSSGMSLKPAQAPAIATQEYELSMTVGVVLLILACFIGVASVIMIAAVIYLWDDVKLQGGRQISRKLDMLMLTENEQLPHQFGAINLAFEDDHSVEKASIAHTSETVDEVGLCQVSVAVGEDDELPQEEPRYVNTPINTEQLSPLQKGSAQYESQEVVLDFTEYEEDEVISSFAHIHTKEFNGDESQPSGGDGQTSDKSDDISPGTLDDKTDDMSNSISDDSHDKSHKQDDKPNDSEDKQEDKQEDKSDDKPQSEELLSHKPSISSNEGSTSNPNQEITSAGPAPPTPPPSEPDQNSKDPMTTTPQTPKAVHFDDSEHVSDRSSSCASSDSTLMLDLAGGLEKLPDFLKEVEVTEL